MVSQLNHKKPVTSSLEPFAFSTAMLLVPGRFSGPETMHQEDDRWMHSCPSFAVIKGLSCKGRRRKVNLQMTDALSGKPSSKMHMQT